MHEITRYITMNLVLTVHGSTVNTTISSFGQAKLFYSRTDVLLILNLEKNTRILFIYYSIESYYLILLLTIFLMFLYQIIHKLEFNV